MSYICKLKTIDLEKYLVKDSKIYSGRDFGQEVRRKEQLDKLDLDEEKYTFIFPDNIKYIADSFTLGLLGKSYVNIGEEKFLKKYKFTTKTDDSKYKKFIEEDFSRGIVYIKYFSRNIL